MNDGGSQPRNRKLPSLYKYRQDYNSILRKVNWGKAENFVFQHVCAAGFSISTLCTLWRKEHFAHMRVQ
jgi:hypothetical protein